MTNGLSQADIEEILAARVAPIAEKIIERITPAIERAALKAEPVVRRVVSEEVMPRVLGAGALVVVGGITLGALVGALVAKRRITKRLRR